MLCSESLYIVEIGYTNSERCVIIVLNVINELCSVGGVAALYFPLIFAQNLQFRRCL